MPRKAVRECRLQKRERKPFPDDMLILTEKGGCPMRAAALSVFILRKLLKNTKYKLRSGKILLF